MNNKNEDTNNNEPNKLESSSLLQGQSQSQPWKKQQRQQQQYEIPLPKGGSAISGIGEKFTSNYSMEDVKRSILYARVLPNDKMGGCNLPEKIVMSRYLELLSFLHNQSFLNLCVLLLSKTLFVKVHRIKEIRFLYWY